MAPDRVVRWPRPRAPHGVPRTLTQHGDVRVDPYYWLRERDNEEVLAHLRAENDFQREQMAPLAGLEERLYEEIKSRIEETDISVPVRRGAWWHFERTREGLSYAIHCRVPAAGRRPDSRRRWTRRRRLEGEQVELDENAEAEGHEFFSLGVLDVSLDDRWIAVGTDFDGAERFTLTVRPLDGQAPLDDQLEDVYYGFTWANDSRHFFYTRVDDAMRPWQVWRHELGTSVDADVLVFQEDDEKYSPGRRPLARRRRHRRRLGVLDDHRAALPAQRRPDRGPDRGRAAPPRRRVLARALHRRERRGLVAHGHQRRRHRLPPPGAARRRAASGDEVLSERRGDRSTGSTPSRASSRSASATTRARRCAWSTCSTATTPSATTCSSARALVDAGERAGDDGAVGQRQLRHRRTCASR